MDLPEREDMTPMDQWRARILHRTLWITSVLACLAYIPGVFAAREGGLWQLILVNTLVFGLLATITLWKTLAFRIRARVFIGAWYLFSVFLLWLLGPVGVGVIWVLAVPVFSALLFGYAGAWSGVALVALCTLVYPFLPASTVTETVALFNLHYTTEAWLAVSGSLLFLSCLISLAIAELLAGLERLLEKQDRSNRQMKTLLEKESALQEELSLSRRQSALGTLAGGVAHDFNNLLVPIMMASESARDQAVEGTEQKRNLDLVITSAERARNLVQQILRFSQNDDVEKAPLALQTVVEEAVHLLRSSAGSGVTVNYLNAAPDAWVLADEDAVHQIIMNLGRNALLALPSDNPEVSLKVGRKRERQIVTIDVSDNGAGIPEAIQERIFDPYFSTRTAGTGTGLGLAIVHRLVTTALNGSITFNSDPAHGTTFTVELPEIPATVQPGSETRTVPPPASADRPSPDEGILIVDDEEMICAMLEATLTRQNYRVTTCNSPEAALDQVRTRTDDFAVAIVDNAMAGLSGLELAEQLRQIRPTLQIILMSGYLTENDLIRARELSISGVIDKPFRRQQILDLLAGLKANPDA